MSEFSKIQYQVDKVVVDYKEFSKIRQWATANKISNCLDDKMFFPLNTFWLELWLDKITCIKCLVELDNYSPVNGRFTGEDWWITFKRDPENHCTRVDGDGEQLTQKSAETIHIFVATTLIYICKQAKVWITKQSANIERENKALEEPYKYKERECFLLNNIIEYVGRHQTKKSIQYRCEVWGVKGHIRHYTDGRTVFIKPYKKGVKKDILEPKSKTYLIEKD